MESHSLLVSWDTDQDGDVDMPELIAGLRSIGVEGSEEELTELANSFDADGSGMVDEEEFLVLYEDVKAGKVKGLGGGMFSMLGSGMKGLIKKKDGT